jgi:hypothetical protein
MSRIASWTSMNPASTRTRRHQAKPPTDPAPIPQQE